MALWRLQHHLVNVNSHYYGGEKSSGSDLTGTGPLSSFSRTGTRSHWYLFITCTSWLMFTHFCLYVLHKTSTYHVFVVASSTLLWYQDQMAARPEGSVLLKSAPELVATGSYASQLFQIPPLPGGGNLQNVIAIGERRRQRVHFFMAENQQELRYFLSSTFVFLYFTHLTDVCLKWNIRTFFHSNWLAAITSTVSLLPESLVYASSFMGLKLLCARPFASQLPIARPQPPPPPPVPPVMTSSPADPSPNAYFGYYSMNSVSR